MDFACDQSIRAERFELLDGAGASPLRYKADPGIFIDRRAGVDTRGEREGIGIQARSVNARIGRQVRHEFSKRLGELALRARRITALAVM
jgi:hypothetical protein